MFRPGWPVAAMFLGYPIWWLLGIVPIVAAILCTVMLVELAQRARIACPRRFGAWLLFLAWAIAGVFVLLVDAPGAVSGGGASRYLTWAFRIVIYVEATIFLLYVGNMRRELSLTRLSKILSWMFVITVAGGVVGTLAPHVNFPSLLELVLPHRVTHITFVKAQIHPSVAQVQEYLGIVTPRPSGPFTYANEWGLNFACFLPFFIHSWCGREAGWRRVVAPLVLVAALIPVVFSLNRGLWAVLIATAAFAAVRFALIGRVRILALMVAGALAISVIIVISPLGSTINARFDAEHNSNQGRSNLGTLALTSMAKGSPVVGYGTTRNVQGSWRSIAIGATADCRACSPPPLGTQGLLWFVSFAHGFGGLMLFLGFFVLVLLRHIRMRTAHATSALAVILSFLVTMPIYDLSLTAMFAVMSATAILWRESVGRRTLANGLRLGHKPEGEPTVFGYVRLVSRQAPAIVACMILGGLVGGVWQGVRGTPWTASVSIFLPEEPRYPNDPSQPITLDTLGQISSSATVLDAVTDAIGHPVRIDSNALTVTANPNSRILNLGYTASSPAAARGAVDAASKKLLDVRTDQLELRRTNAIRRFSKQRSSLRDAIGSLSKTRKSLSSGPQSATKPAALNALTKSRKALENDFYGASLKVSQVMSQPLISGSIVRPTSLALVKNRWLVVVDSGTMLGLLAGVLLAFLRNSIGSQMRPGVLSVTGTRLRVLDELGQQSPESTRRTAALLGDRSYLTVPPHDEAAAGIAQELRKAAASRREDPDSNTRPRQGLRSVILVASTKTHDRQLTQTAATLRAAGCAVDGAVLVRAMKTKKEGLC